MINGKVDFHILLSYVMLNKISFVCNILFMLNKFPRMGKSSLKVFTHTTHNFLKCLNLQGH